ncbi:hypothetical protein FA95DRAFT_503650 [Auriscalpium vulgare]|uniref:Uncharacterized protein n=1 Tax=Auriscalpium vulgare TaxID=40419 RepID=A0ACB8RFM4_9AGAM|nr:hypothetical protein FA95DRAFT_503650 [Auriscalpium vulgare]
MRPVFTIAPTRSFVERPGLHRLRPEPTTALARAVPSGHPSAPPPTKLQSSGRRTPSLRFVRPTRLAVDVEAYLPALRGKCMRSDPSSPCPFSHICSVHRFLGDASDRTESSQGGLAQVDVAADHPCSTAPSLMKCRSAESIYHGTSRRPHTRLRTHAALPPWRASTRTSPADQGLGLSTRSPIANDIRRDPIRHQTVESYIDRSSKECHARNDRCLKTPRRPVAH